MSTEPTTPTATDLARMSLDDRLRALRARRRWSLRALRSAIEQRTGHAIAPSYLLDLERGETSPTITTLVRIAAGYDMTVQELVAPVSFAVKEIISYDI